MIKILDNPNSKEFVALCKQCRCKFTFEQIDLHRLNDVNNYVWCPNCERPVVIKQLIEYKRPEPKLITAENAEWSKR